MIKPHRIYLVFMHTVKDIYWPPIKFSNKKNANKFMKKQANNANIESMELVSYIKENIYNG